MRGRDEFTMTYMTLWHFSAASGVEMDRGRIIPDNVGSTKFGRSYRCIRATIPLCTTIFISRSDNLAISSHSYPI